MLAGRPVASGPGYGFWWQQFAYAAGMRVEILEPHQPEVNDFLRRFLDRNGPGPHHMTFKVPDLGTALDRGNDLGYRPVNVDVSDPTWKEAFLHPKDAPGIVVQLAETAFDHDAPALDMSSVPRLLRVTHSVAELGDGIRLFVDLLQGEEQDTRETDEGISLDLAWPGGGVVRLIQPTLGSEAAAWLGERRGRVHHIAFGGASLADKVVAPDDNSGTRVVLVSSPDVDSGV